MALTIVLLFFAHPAVTLYQGTIANLVIVLIFLASVVLGSTAPPRLVIAAIAGLTFFEPEVLVTRTLSFNVIGDGLLIGAAIKLIPRISDLPRPAKLMIAAIGVYSFLYLAVPLVTGSTGWRSTYEGFVIVRYPILIALAAIYFRNSRHTRILLMSIAGGVAVLGVVGLVEGLHIYQFNTWLYGTYLEWQRLDPDVIDKISRFQYRIRGLIGDPVDTGLLVVVGMGVWFAIFTTARGRLLKIGAAIVLVLLLLVVVGTAARTAYLSFAAGGLSYLIWMVSRRKWQLLLSVFLGTVLTAGVLFALVTFTPRRGSTDRLIESAYNRVASAFGTKNPYSSPGEDSVADVSVTGRFAQFGDTPLTVLGSDADPSAGGSAEYLTLLLKFGVVGLIPYLFFWALLAWWSARSALSGANRGFALAAFWISIVVPVGAWGTNILLDPAVMTVVSIIAGAVAGTISLSNGVRGHQTASSTPAWSAG